MKRISHDLPGVTSRIAKLRDELTLATEEAERVWRDDKGRAYFKQRISPIAPTLTQLVSSLTRSIEIFEDIAKKVQDPEAD